MPGVTSENLAHFNLERRALYTIFGQALFFGLLIGARLPYSDTPGGTGSVGCPSQTLFQSQGKAGIGGDVFL